MEAEAFKTTLLTELNPINILVLQSQGTSVSNILDDFNQWSFYVRLRHGATWGAPLTHVEGQRNDVVYGAIEGFVYEDAPGPQGGLAGISVQLDSGRTARTGAGGRYRFDDVPEGAHSVTLNVAELTADLAADLSPGPAAEGPVAVHPRSTSRLDLRVVKTSSSLRGTLLGLSPEDQGLFRMENIVIYLTSAGKFDSYTTCDKNGKFAFFNLRNGHYILTVDRTTLPENYVMASPGEVSVDLGAPTPLPIVFQMEKHLKNIPVRKILQSGSAPDEK